ncbi:MAG: MFS transporter [Clostridiales bacterium]|nr:MFS transporter [Clostridiales bacterium]
MNTSPASPVSGKKSVSAKLRQVWNVFAYAAGYASGGGVTQIQNLYYMNFLLYALLIPPWQAALILGLSKVWDGFIDPVIGVLVDRTKSRFGSCRPWILASVLPVAVTYFLLWTDLGISSEVLRFAYFFLAQILFSTALSIGTVPYEALLPRMVDGYNERTNFSAFRMIFSGVWAVASTWIYPKIIRVESLSDYAAHKDDFALLGIVFGIMFAAPMLVTFIGAKEKPRSVPDGKLTIAGVFKSYAEILRVRLYKKYYALNMLGQFVSYATSISLVLFVLLVYGEKDPVPLGIGSLTLPFALTFLVVNIRGAFEIGFFIPNVVVMKKKNKHFPLFIDLPLLFAGLIIFFFFVDSSAPIWVCLAGAAFLGMGISCLSIVPNTLMPDLPDVDELTYGKRREGENGGLLTLGRQLVQGLCFLIFGFILAAFELSEDTASPEQATAATLSAVKFMLCALPFLGGIAMFLVSRSYNLDAKSHAAIKARIAEKREKGFAETTPEEQRTFEEITGIEYSKLWIAGKGGT